MFAIFHVFAVGSFPVFSAVFLNMFVSVFFMVFSLVCFDG
jgi:hypothetical protein